MKLHTLNRKYCLCKRHPRKFKKEFNKWGEEPITPLFIKMKVKGPFLERYGNEYETHWIGPKHPRYKEIK